MLGKCTNLNKYPLPLVELEEVLEGLDAAEAFVAVELLVVDQVPCNQMNQPARFFLFGSLREHMYSEEGALRVFQ